jgi:hypothetical protein
MKQIKILISLLVALLLIVLVAACEGPEGPAGPQGPQGLQGDDYVNWEGFAEGIQCAQCHNPDIDTTYYVWARRTQWSVSKHANGGAYTENSATCAVCHTTEGFIQQELGQTITEHAVSSPIGCFACHSPHSRADFSLRTVEPVTMLAGVAGEADYTFDYGNGNLCASCHKPRSISPKPDPTKTATTDTITITNSRWYQHYGVQGLMLAGQNGFEFEGYTYSNSYHTNAAAILDQGCAMCHMAEAERNPAGGHTMWLEYEGTEIVTGCTTTGCHSAPMTLDYNDVQTDTEALLDSLGTLLLDRGWITASGSINASTGSPLKIAPAYLSGAMYNYFFVEHDLSLGVHNTNYTQQLLESSIAELTAE